MINMRRIYLIAMNKTEYHPLSVGQAHARHHRTSSAVTIFNLNGNPIERLEIGMLFRIVTPCNGLDCRVISNLLTVWSWVVKSKKMTHNDRSHSYYSFDSTDSIFRAIRPGSLFR